ncbi:MAG TPA: hypothetical protein PLA83_04435 [Deltaproteobacteria bacterium]|jgi:hypothetical protein|nr:hypothetical protein [Deltaproteobacteria bacterium]HQI00965.1 hypothetical protein [Deltaproteobacteria bacterium]HQJ08849.1 hypothetical protein [Deltaproteobacteria bacterium]
MGVRKSEMLMLYLALNLLACTVLLFHAFISSESGSGRIREERAFVRSLGLTDICLFTEASYTRNPAVADRHTSFQDSPMCFDHFPSGALVALPPHLNRHALD